MVSRCFLRKADEVSTNQILIYNVNTQIFMVAVVLLV